MHTAFPFTAVLTLVGSLFFSASAGSVHLLVFTGITELSVECASPVVMAVDAQIKVEINIIKLTFVKIDNSKDIRATLRLFQLIIY